MEFLDSIRNKYQNLSTKTKIAITGTVLIGSLAAGYLWGNNNGYARGYNFGKFDGHINGYLEGKTEGKKLVFKLVPGSKKKFEIAVEDVIQNFTDDFRRKHLK